MTTKRSTPRARRIDSRAVPSTSPLRGSRTPNPLSWDLLGELQHMAVGVEHVQRAVTPRPVHRAGQDGRGRAPHSLGLRVDVLDQEGHLAKGTAGHTLRADEPG